MIGMHGLTVSMASLVYDNMARLFSLAAYHYFNDGAGVNLFLFETQV